MTWGCKHDPGKAIDIYKGAEHLLTYHYGADKPKSYFHPVRLPGGHVLTLDSPYDHYWHHGLYFTWKLINGFNFWEENEPAAGSGRMRTIGCMAAEAGEQGIHLQQKLVWECGEDHALLMEEERSIRISDWDSADKSAPAGGYWIAMDMTFRNVMAEVLRFDRTSPETYSWGGYAGMSFRPVRSMAAAAVANSEGGSTVEQAHGMKAKWCDFAGPLDGGKDISGGICMYDHPGNPRFSAPFYVWNTPELQFLQSAFLFEEAFDLPPGETLRLRYGMLVHTGRLTAEELASGFEQYAKKLAAD